MVWGPNSLGVHLPRWSIYLCCQAASEQDLDGTERCRNTNTSGQPWAKRWARPMKLMLLDSSVHPQSVPSLVSVPLLWHLSVPNRGEWVAYRAPDLFTPKGPFHGPSYQQCNLQDVVSQINHGRRWPALSYLPKTNGYRTEGPTGRAVLELPHRVNGGTHFHLEATELDVAVTFLCSITWHKRAISTWVAWNINEFWSHHPALYETLGCGNSRLEIIIMMHRTFPLGSICTFLKFKISFKTPSINAQ